MTTVVGAAAALEEDEGPGHVMLELSDEGETIHRWDPNNADEVAVARSTFDRLRSKGYIAYQVRGAGETGAVLNTFDPDAERMILAPATVGG